MSLWVGGLLLIAGMALFLGIGRRFEAASRARQENAERNEWLPVTAHVKSCFLVQDHPIARTLRTEWFGSAHCMTSRVAV